jgi:hypothetical protein
MELSRKRCDWIILKVWIRSVLPNASKCSYPPSSTHYLFLKLYVLTYFIEQKLCNKVFTLFHCCHLNASKVHVYIITKSQYFSHININIIIFRFIYRSPNIIPFIHVERHNLENTILKDIQRGVIILLLYKGGKSVEQCLVFLLLFYYSYVHTRLGSFLPPAPTPSLTTHSASSLSPPPPQYPAETILPLFLILL